MVTGASRGIGRFLATTLASRGAAVVCSSRSLDSSGGEGGTLRETVDFIVQAGGAALAVPARITDPADAEALVKRTVDEYGRIDLLVNNAGIYPRGKLTETPPDVWLDIMEINVNALFYCTRFALPVMERQGSGRIINLSSSLASRYYADRIAYSVTKSVVDRFSQGLALEMKDRNVWVNAYIPGLTATAMTDWRGVPVEELGPSFLWLVSPETDGFTGQIVDRQDFGTEWGPGIPWGEA